MLSGGLDVTFRAIREDSPGEKWRGLFRGFWPAYSRWFFDEGAGPRPPRVIAERRLRQAMPALVPTYRRLVELAGGGSDEARFLALYCPAPYLQGCSQAVWTGDEPALVRNYDYGPSLWEAVLLSSKWNDRRVMAMSDCLWGVLDGINESGLVVSLAFGGRNAIGVGFGSPLILRYVLEFCDTAHEAADVLRRVPTNMAYNVTVVDARGEFFTVYLAPDRPAVCRRWPLATNHQPDGHWQSYVEATSSVERERVLADRLGDPTESLDRLAESFLRPPLFNIRYRQALGTLYTAVYYPLRRQVHLLWPGRRMVRGLDDFEETELPLHFDVG